MLKYILTPSLILVTQFAMAQLPIKSHDATPEELALQKDNGCKWEAHLVTASGEKIAIADNVKGSSPAPISIQAADLGKTKIKISFQNANHCFEVKWAAQLIVKEKLTGVADVDLYASKHSDNESMANGVSVDLPKLACGAHDLRVNYHWEVDKSKADDSQLEGSKKKQIVLDVTGCESSQFRPESVNTTESPVS